MVATAPRLVTPQAAHYCVYCLGACSERLLASTVARWPGTIKPGTSDHQLCFYDFLPTALELAGIPTSKLPPKIDGHSFAPTLLGKSSQPQPPFIYHEFSGPQDPVFVGVTFPKSFSQNVRMGQWSGVAVCFTGSLSPLSSFF
jgi:arylsulfatase A-like enzyme